MEYQPEQIFQSVTAHWKNEVLIDKIIYAFFESMQLSSYIYPDTLSGLKKLKAQGIGIATLTDVATGIRVFIMHVFIRCEKLWALNHITGTRSILK